MINPFDDDGGQFYVLVNQEGEHCLWPIFAAVPGGWTVTYGAADRKSALRYVEENWQDMRPKSLREERSGIRVAAGTVVEQATPAASAMPVTGDPIAN